MLGTVPIFSRRKWPSESVLFWRLSGKHDFAHVISYLGGAPHREDGGVTPTEVTGILCVRGEEHERQKALTALLLSIPVASNAHAQCTPEMPQACTM
jgi:hypothetical protein